VLSFSSRDDPQRPARTDAFIAAWLPGTEGSGVTDALYGNLVFTGKLPMTWPVDMSQIPINVGDTNYTPLVLCLEVWVIH